MKLPLIIAQRIVNDDGTQIGVDTTVRPSFPYAGVFDVVEKISSANLTLQASTTELNAANTATLKLDTKDILISEFFLVVKFNSTELNIIDSVPTAADIQVNYLGNFEVVTNKLSNDEILIKAISSSPKIYNDIVADISLIGIKAGDPTLSVDITKSYIVDQAGVQKSIEGNLVTYTVKPKLVVVTTTTAAKVDLPASGIGDIGVYPFIGTGIFSILFLLILIHLATDSKKNSFEKRF